MLPLHLGKRKTTTASFVVFVDFVSGETVGKIMCFWKAKRRPKPNEGKTKENDK